LVQHQEIQKKYLYDEQVNVTMAHMSVNLYDYHYSAQYKRIWIMSYNNLDSPQLHRRLIKSNMATATKTKTAFKCSKHFCFEFKIKIKFYKNHQKTSSAQLEIGSG
jgi:hypothetical protein